jgi:hypothetical protein
MNADEPHSNRPLLLNILLCVRLPKVANSSTQLEHRRALPSKFVPECASGLKVIDRDMGGWKAGVVKTSP